jgi:2Fe-2S ferredoxin
MPRVIIESPGAKTLEVDAPEGGSLADLCDEHGASIPFSCRSASCGTCRIDVLEGADLLEPPKDDELDVLDIFADDSSRRRLTCQAQLLARHGVVRIRPVDDGGS